MCNLCVWDNFQCTELLLLPPLLTDGQITLAHIQPHPLLLFPLLTDGQITLAHISPHPLLLLLQLTEGGALVGVAEYEQV